jgi:hypothetical protein
MKHIFILDTCVCTPKDKVTLKGLVFRHQKEDSIYFTEICCSCSRETRIRQLQENMDEIWKMEQECNEYLEAEKSAWLLRYIDKK